MPTPAPLTLLCLGKDLMPRFCTALNAAGHRCSARALPGQSFCYSHHPQPSLPGWCAYQTRTGEPCRAFALRGQDHCFTHSRRNRRARHPRVRLHGQVGPSATPTHPSAALPNWPVFNDLPQSKTALGQPLSIL